ncbi:MAG: hypothetical protein QNJ94_04075 [Alphaproteobacteria bacterium]|nr:hypothetical protein [Alphaproteobacteria bacterium]
MVPLIARMRRLCGQLSPDVQAVVDATYMLQVKPFQFFQIAYRQWYGRDAREKELERLFMSYLYTQRPPAWARHLAREVLQRAEQGRLDRAVYGLPRRRPPEGMSFAELERWSLLIYVGALAVIFFVIPALR